MRRKSTAPKSSTSTNPTENKENSGFVRVSKAFTKNLGNYSSYKCEVSLELPIGITPEQADRADLTYKLCLSKVDEKFETFLNDATDIKSQFDNFDSTKGIR